MDGCGDAGFAACPPAAADSQAARGCAYRRARSLRRVLGHDENVSARPRTLAPNNRCSSEGLPRGFAFRQSRTRPVRRPPASGGRTPTDRFVQPSADDAVNQRVTSMSTCCSTRYRTPVATRRLRRSTWACRWSRVSENGEPNGWGTRYWRASALPTPWHAPTTNIRDSPAAGGQPAWRVELSARILRRNRRVGNRRLRALHANSRRGAERAVALKSRAGPDDGIAQLAARLRAIEISGHCRISAILQLGDAVVPRTSS